MTVKITKPEINVREQLNELKKPTGLAGEAMLRAETPQEQQALIGVGRRNLIINGDFDVWQRGTSFSASAYTADRWLSSVGTVTKDGAALKHVSTTTDPYLLYKVEDVGNKLAGNKAVLSFYLKTSGSDNRLQYVTFSGTNYYHSQMYQLPSELEGYTHWVCPVEITTATTDQIRIVIELHNVSGHTSWLRKVQLELGKVATPFEHRSYGEELALCQRYYERFDASGNFYTAVSSANTPRINGTWMVAKRVAPTMTATGGWAMGGVIYGYEGYHATASDRVTPSWTADAEL
tara:strand:+ start:284 stop:1156 length:873 start_codon:yes stop_codon:yes gene_type:complete